MNCVRLQRPLLLCTHQAVVYSGHGCSHVVKPGAAFSSPAKAVPLWLIQLASRPCRSPVDEILGWPGDFLKAVWERRVIDSFPLLFCAVKSCLQSWVTSNSPILHFSQVLFSWSICQPKALMNMRSSFRMSVFLKDDASSYPSRCRLSQGLRARLTGKVASVSQMTNSWSHCFLGFGMWRPPGWKAFFSFLFHPGGSSWNTENLNHIEEYVAAIEICCSLNSRSWEPLFKNTSPHLFFPHVTQSSLKFTM